MAILSEVRSAVVELDLGLTRLVEKALADRVPPLDVVNAMSEGMTEVGERYSREEYYLAELLMAGEVMKAGLEIVNPLLKSELGEPVGRVVIGTIEGDLHDIGKNLVIALLSSAGFEIYDLGIDVPPSVFVDKVQEVNATILAMSALLTTTAANMGAVIKGLQHAGLREGLKVIVGGAAVTPELAQEIGADAFGKDAMEAQQICKRWST
jgi:5-methyltetrahydrofolate--homocysteine methyltransferase